MDSKMCRLKVLALAGTMFVVLLLTVQFVASCDRGSMPALTDGAYNSVAGNDDADTAGERVTMSVEGPLGGEFTFEPLDGDGSSDKHGPNAYEFTLEYKGGDGGSGTGGGGFGTPSTVELTIKAKKNAGFEWKYALGYIHYDADKYNPVEFIPGDIFGEDEKDVLNTALFKEKGRIGFWTGLKQFRKKEAKHGGVIGTFVIELAPWQPPRSASEAPIGNENKVVNIGGGKDHVTQTRYIHFSEVNRGDGDLNGEVGVPDITPLAWFYGDSVYDHPGQKIVDYNDDLYFTEADIDVITENYLYTVQGYQIEIYEDEQKQNLIASTTYPDHQGPAWEARARFRHLRDCELPYQYCSNEYHDVDKSSVMGHGNAEDGFYLTHDGAIGYVYTNAEFADNTEVWLVVTPFDNETPENYGISSEPIFVDFGPLDEEPTASCEITWEGKLEEERPPYVPLTVTLDASASEANADGAELAEFHWDLDSNGIYETIEYWPETSHEWPIVLAAFYRIWFKVKDSYGNWSDEIPLDIRTYDCDMIRFTNWRINDLDPGDEGNSTQMQDNMGSDLMQYVNGVDVLENPLPIPGIVLQCQFENISNRFANLNAVRFSMDIVESSGSQISPGLVFGTAYLIPYDGNYWMPEFVTGTTGICIWNKNEETGTWVRSAYNPSSAHFRIDGFLGPWDKMHEIPEPPDNYSALLMAPYLPQYSGGILWFDLSINYAQDDDNAPWMSELFSDIAPYFGEVRSFELLLRYKDEFLNNTDPELPYIDARNRYDGFDIWIEDLWLGSERTFYSDADSNQTPLNAPNDPLEVRYRVVE
ncbi:hypothetical protein J7J84_01280 [bacterium]|nr:hypothetical protein [bacterium]